ncbi:MAG: hypothetical protein ACRDZ9_05025 [Acidimicrobiales bacterium]
MSGAQDRPADRPLIGWRYWALGSEGWLRSITQRRVEWVPGRPVRAACVGGGHPAPAPGCGCGVYGAGDLATLAGHGLCLPHDEVLVAGEVGLWGAVLIDEDGIRGQFGYPASLLVVRETASQPGVGAVRERLVPYGVPVSEISFVDAVGDVSAAVMAFQAMSRSTAPTLR